MMSRLIQLFGDNPNRGDACLALARCKSAVGDAAGATALVERAFKLEPTRYETAEAILTHYARRGEMPRVGQLLARLAVDPRWGDEPFRRVVGHVLPGIPNTADLLNLCRPLVETDRWGLPWLAETAMKLNLPEAAALLDSAVRRPGATSDDWLRKALFASRGNPAAGPNALAEAKAKLAPADYFALVAVYAESAAGSTFVPEAGTPAEKKLLAQARLAVKLSRSQPAEGGKVLEAFLAEKDILPADSESGAAQSGDDLRRRRNAGGPRSRDEPVERRDDRRARDSRGTAHHAERHDGSGTLPGRSRPPRGAG